MVLGGSWVVISGITTKITIVPTHIRGLITVLITTDEPPSKTEIQTALLKDKKRHVRVLGYTDADLNSRFASNDGGKEVRDGTVAGHRFFYEW